VQDHITMVSETEGAPIVRAGNPEWEHAYRAPVLAAISSMPRSAT
jgi:hypothetical protein